MLFASFSAIRNRMVVIRPLNFHKFQQIFTSFEKRIPNAGKGRMYICYSKSINNFPTIQTAAEYIHINSHQKAIGNNRWSMVDSRIAQGHD